MTRTSSRQGNEGAKDRGTKWSGRRAILDLLKENGAQHASELAEELGVSAMAVRQHLYDLETEEFATFDEVRQPRGRPRKYWRLTPAADRFFPDGHAHLTAELLDAIKVAFGQEGTERLIEARSVHQIAAYEARLSQRSLLRRSEELAAIRTEEGYMAHVETDEDGTIYLVEKHCPICVAATECSGLCAGELFVFRSVLGPDTEIERTDHILAGKNRCVYRISEAPVAE